MEEYTTAEGVFGRFSSPGAALDDLARTYEPENTTCWYHLECWPVEPDGSIPETTYTRDITVDPIAPPCADGKEHRWQSPLSVVGGIKENPGVSGHGGGVVSTEVCAHCGAYRISDSWAQNPETGQQGLESVKYMEADEASEAWIAD